MAQPLLNDPSQVVVFLVLVIGLVIWLSKRKGLTVIFRYLTPVLWIYLLPMVATTLGILPPKSPAYDWIKTHFLPAALLLLLLSANLPFIARLGGKAVLVMLAGTAGIVIGGPVVLLLFRDFLPEDAWRGIAALSGSWIGGSPNLVAISESVETPENILGPVIVVDTVVGYSWMGIVIALSAFQDRFDRWAGVDRKVVDDMNKRMGEIQEARRRPLNFADLTLMMVLAFGGGWLCLEAGKILPELGDVVKSFAWTVILVTTLGLLLSFTRLS